MSFFAFTSCCSFLFSSFFSFFSACFYLHSSHSFTVVTLLFFTTFFILFLLFSPFSYSFFLCLAHCCTFSSSYIDVSFQSSPSIFIVSPHLAPKLLSSFSFCCFRYSYFLRIAFFKFKFPCFSFWYCFLAISITLAILLHFFNFLKFYD